MVSRRDLLAGLTGVALTPLATKPTTATHGQPFDLNVWLHNCVDTYKDPCSNCAVVCQVRPGKHVTVEVHAKYRGDKPYGDKGIETLDARFRKIPDWEITDRLDGKAVWRSPPWFRYKGWTWPLPIRDWELTAGDTITAKLTLKVPDDLRKRKRVTVRLKHADGYLTQTVCIEPTKKKKDDKHDDKKDEC